MAVSGINQIVARALRWHMDRAGLSEKALGTRAGVSPRTVANFLRPTDRAAGSRGKEPSGKLTELALIAAALGVRVADLVDDQSDEERERDRQLRAAMELLRGVAAAPAPAAQPAAPSGKPLRPAA